MIAIPGFATLAVMVAESPTSWRELARFSDLLLARAVATSIAAMEFDVRLRGGGESPRPPFRIEVQGTHWADLAEVLEEIVDEQVEFDRQVLESRGGRDVSVIVFITLTGAADILILLNLLELP